MSPCSLEAENLHLWRGERHVLRGIAFSLLGGQCLKLTGANGAGKTTLLRAVAGLIYPDEGQIRFQGRDVREDLPGFQGALAYLGHEPPLKADLSATENLEFWIGTRRRVPRAQCHAALERVGAGAFAQRLVRTLSAGQRRRVALAGLLLCAVPVWLLDEPTTNLDAAGQRLVSELIAEQLARGGLVIAALHHELAPAFGELRQLELAA